jgi:hypothetical protein
MSFFQRSPKITSSEHMKRDKPFGNFNDEENDAEGRASGICRDIPPETQRKEFVG